MTDVVFAFDVEDPVNECSDDAALRICRIFAEEGVPVAMFLAGEKARVLRQRGRRDVIEALADMEVCYHGNYWGDYPIPAMEYGCDMGWDDAVAWALRTESPGLNDIAEITGAFPVAWCVHQAQWCPQMAYALKLAGVRCAAGGPRGWFMTWLSWGRASCTLSSQPDWSQRHDPTQADREKPVMDVAAALDRFKASFDDMVRTEPFVTIAGHPTCFVTSDWGGLYGMAATFRNGGPGAYARPASGIPSQRRSPEDSEAAYTFLREQIRWLKKRSDVNLTSYSALCDRDDEPGMRWLPLDDCVALAAKVAGTLDPVVHGGTSFSCADVYGMLSWLCAACRRQGRWPDHVPVHRLLGPVMRPREDSAPVTLSRESIFAGALAAEAFALDDRRAAGTLRASMVDVGPGTWLRALAAFVSASVESAMPEEITVAPGPQLPAVADAPVITRRRFSSSNHRPDLDPQPLLDLLRWQSWSYRPAVPQR